MSAPSNKPQLDIPLAAPPQPTVRSQDEFNRLSPEQQAAALYAWQGFWLKATPACAPNSGTRIVVPEPPAQIETESWKQPSTAEELESTRDWNKS